MDPMRAGGHRRLAVVWSALLLASSFAASADTLEETGTAVEDPIVTDRPTDSASPLLVPRHTFQVEAENAMEFALNAPAPAPEEVGVVEECAITIDVEGVGRVRLVGVDTPEIGDCGYDEAQIERSLSELSRKGVHQESEVAEHVLHLLVAAGRLPAEDDASPHPEVMAVRFDPVRSPPDVMPRAVREAVQLPAGYSITWCVLRQRWSTWVV